MPAQRSLYEILNVTPEAEPVVIEAAYRALMKKYHPDQAPAEASAAASAAEINRAFAVLRDPQRRADYDRREWTGRQDITLARYQPPPPAAGRGLKVFGWGGWVVAAILGGVIAAMAGRVTEIAAARAEAARAAAAAQPDFRSQPSAPDASLVPAATLAEIRAEAFAPEERAAPSRVASRLAPAPDPERAAPPPDPRPPRKPAAARDRKPEKAGEPDFLEREGYIY